MYRKSESLYRVANRCTSVDGWTLGSDLSVRGLGEKIMSGMATRIVRISSVRMEYRNIKTVSRDRRS